MSKVAVKGAATGTGVFTLESPGTNTDRTFTLPDGDGELVRAATAGGMPLAGSDPVVESGSNTDGEWTRWADGTQIVSGQLAPSSNNNSGSTKTFAITFIAAPFVVASSSQIVSSTLGGSYVVETRSQTTTSVVVKILLHKPTTISDASGVTIHIIATGRWK